MKIKSFLWLFLCSICSMVAQDLALANQDGKFGYITKTGDWQIKPQFKIAKNFSGDLAEAMTDDKKWGFINRKGEWAIQPMFEKTKAFDSGVAIVLKDNQWIYINTDGEQILKDVTTDKLYDFEEGYAIVRQGDKVGFINAKGEVVVPVKFSKVFGFVNGYAKAQENEKWGLVDGSGNYFVPTEYDGVSNVYHDKVIVSKGGVYGIISNGAFKEVEGAQKVWDFMYNPVVTYAEKDGKMGFVNAEGKWEIAPAYEKARAFVNGLAPVMKDKNWGYINRAGEAVIPFQYKDAEIFSKDGLAPVKLSKLWGFINTKGDLVIDDKYDITASGFSVFKRNNEKGFIDGLARVKEKKSWYYINTNGEILKDMEFENLELFQ
ncbi:WG repeat-containing protein [Mangrovimonas sp. DI 80]|uniref:WG repeat-containing protein n=1 Tax=Mangrovimonas sp. DI 80 TaxID=1779330 RepID=UPI000978430B|nr:WG repeat-containing protein [Mangrovimonas sp. DI 80]OMP31431.1 hypothetical protein BKM32_06850 [Mangrovimonas sp. DI 80]